MKTNTMTLCLWFDDRAEEAAYFYTGIFKDGSIGRISRYGEEGFEYHRKPVGFVSTIEFSLNGMHFIGLNGGPKFTFNEAASIIVYCETQSEIDYYWEKLTEGGEEGPCGWLKDKFGVSWQIVPSILPEILAGSDVEKIKRVSNAFLKMKKFDIESILTA